MSENAFILLSGWSNGVGCYITRGCLLSLLKFNCPPPVSPPWGHIPAINLLLPNDQPLSFYKLSVPLGPTFPLCIRSCCPLSIKQLFRLCPFSLLHLFLFFPRSLPQHRNTWWCYRTPSLCSSDTVVSGPNTHRQEAGVPMPEFSEKERNFLLKSYTYL